MIYIKVWVEGQGVGCHLIVFVYFLVVLHLVVSSSQPLYLGV